VLKSSNNLVVSVILECSNTWPFGPFDLGHMLRNPSWQEQSHSLHGRKAKEEEDRARFLLSQLGTHPQWPEDLLVSPGSSRSDYLPVSQPWGPWVYYIGFWVTFNVQSTAESKIISVSMAKLKNK
jgi:hypothetical protein